MKIIFTDVLGSTSLAGKKFLDAGCGTGLFSQVAVDRGAQVTSLDVGQGLLDQVAAKTDSYRVVGNLLDLPFSRGSFDVVLCTEAIEHTEDPRKAVSELKRVCAPGAQLIVTTPNSKWHWAITAANWLDLRPYAGLENWVSWRDLSKWVGSEGFQIIRHQGFNSLPFIHRSLYTLNDRLDQLLSGTKYEMAMINMLLVAEYSRDTG